MLNIAFAPNDKVTAEMLKSDLTESNIQLEHPVLIVLVSTESNADVTVQKAIQKAKEAGTGIIPILTRPAVIPNSLVEYPALDFTRGYQFEQVVAYINKQEQVNRPDTRRRTLVLVVIVVILMFAASIYGFTSGLIAFPEEEFEEAAAQLDATRDLIIQPTLTLYQPQSTQDAQNFPATVEAVPTRLRPFVILTGTALPQFLQEQGETTPVENTSSDTQPTMNPTLVFKLTEEVVRLTSTAQASSVRNTNTQIATATPAAPTMTATPVPTITPTNDPDATQTAAVYEVETALAIVNQTATANANGGQ